MKYLAVIGREPELSLAELRALYGQVDRIAPHIGIFESDTDPNIDRHGGVLKLARKLEGITPLEYLKNLPAGKITLGFSDYSCRNSYGEARASSHAAMTLKTKLQAAGRSVRVLPNSLPTISCAAAYHNGLGRSPLNVEIIRFRKEYYVSVGSQNIEAYGARDQARPDRDAKVGMLPPKLAQMLINLCGPLPSKAEKPRLLDPFCGTGVVLQEAVLVGYRAYGTDREPQMVEYTKNNLNWLSETLKKDFDYEVEEGDAMHHTWRQPIDAVAGETYLGPPLSSPPSDIKFKTISTECKELTMRFLENLAPQLKPGTPVTLALPAWRRPDETYLGFLGRTYDIFTHQLKSVETRKINPLDEIAALGYNVNKDLGPRGLLYARSHQIVAREVIVLRKN